MAVCQNFLVLDGNQFKTQHVLDKGIKCFQTFQRLFVIFSVAVQFSLVFMSSEVSDTCTNILQEERSHLRFEVKCEKDTFSISSFTCSSLLHPIAIRIHFIRQLNGSDNTNVYCIGLEKYYKRARVPPFMYPEIEYQLDFNKNRPAGLLVANESCNRPAEICLLDISFLTAILSLNQFWYTSADSSFWNFSSPWFQLEYNWFFGLHVKVFVLPWKEIWGLQNTSLQILTVRRKTHSIEWKNLRLPYLPTLKQLTLSDIGLDHFCKGDVDAVPELEYLDVSYNSFLSVPTAIKQIKNLFTLDFTGSLLCQPLYGCVKVSRPIIMELNNLETLDQLSLGSNLMTDSPLWLLQLPNLRFLNLSDGQIKSIRKDTFDNLPNLKALILSNNKIKKLENCFPQKLDLLDLHGNNFSSYIPIFRPYSVFDSLDLSRTELSDWPSLEHATIGVLNLSYNNFKNLTTMRKIIIVKSLILSHNHISSWDSKDIFHWVHCCIDLSFNRIAFVTTIMSHSLSKEGLVDLRGNPFDCSVCTILDLQDWILAKGSGKTTILRPLQCYSPVHITGTDIMSAPVNEKLCRPKSPNLLLMVGTPVGVVCLLLFAACLLMYNYRFQISYMMYLYKIRKGNQSSAPGAIFDAFVCYSGKDRPWVLGQLRPALEGGIERYRLCLHDRDFLLGSHITRNIVNSIDRSRKTLVILSREFIRSKWCQWELDMAHHRLFEDSNDFLILLRREPLERSKLPRHVKFLMDTRTYLEWPENEDKENTEEAYKRLKRVLGKSIYQSGIEETPKLEDVSDLL